MKLEPLTVLLFTLIAVFIILFLPIVPYICIYVALPAAILAIIIVTIKKVNRNSAYSKLSGDALIFQQSVDDALPKFRNTFLICLALFFILFMVTPFRYIGTKLLDGYDLYTKEGDGWVKQDDFFRPYYYYDTKTIEIHRYVFGSDHMIFVDGTLPMYITYKIDDEDTYLNTALNVTDRRPYGKRYFGAIDQGIINAIKAIVYESPKSDMIDQKKRIDMFREVFKPWGIYIISADTVR